MASANSLSSWDTARSTVPNCMSSISWSNEMDGSSLDREGFALFLFDRSLVVLDDVEGTDTLDRLSPAEDPEILGFFTVAAPPELPLGTFWRPANEVPELL